MKTDKKRIYDICAAAMTASLYVVLTMISAAAGLSSGVIQFRISEALCILSVFTPAAIPGLTVGCALSNLLTDGSVYDVIFGSLATLAGAAGVYLLRRLPCLAPLPYVAANVLVIPFVLAAVYGSEQSISFFFLTVGLGEIVCAWAGGIILYLVLKKTPLPELLTGGKRVPRE